MFSEYEISIVTTFSAGMLPKPVADDLRQGRTTEAQSFSNATVYFRFEIELFKRL